MKNLLFMALSATVLMSCQKEPLTSQQTLGETSEKNSADVFVDLYPESVRMTAAEVDSFLVYCPTWDRETIVSMVCEAPTSTPVERYRYLVSFLPDSRTNDEPRVESIIQQTSRKRIIDANANLVALTIANLGMITGGQLVGIDYHKTSSNLITNTDVFLAGWAFGTTNQNGAQFAAFDTYIEFQDLEPTYTMELSGGNYLIEAALVYNGPSTSFSFYNTQTQQSETRTVETGELLVYGPESEFGELFFNLTFADETLGSDVYNTATIQGPIPGVASGSAPPIALTGGNWPVVTQ